jgi:uncharacterized protein YlxW (UPF0749 family)
MGNQPVTIYASTVLVLWVILAVILLLIFAVALVQWYYHKKLNIIYDQQDRVRDDLSDARRKLHRHTSDLVQLTALVHEQALKNKTNLQLIADKINEMNEYYGSTGAQTVESVQEVVTSSPVAMKEAPKELGEDTETLPNNVIQFPGPKKPK